LTVLTHCVIIHYKMIKSFNCKITAAIFRREAVSRFSTDIQRMALKKLLVLDAVERVEDLRIPPGNRLEKLFGDRRDQYSIRINERWRICFRWQEGDAWDVEIVDYH